MELPRPIPPIRLELRPSRLDPGGVGVFAASRMPRKSKVADGLGERDFEDVVAWTEFQSYSERLKRKVMAFCVGTPEGFVPPPGFDFNKLTIEWYFNHSCEGNCGFDDDGDFVAMRDIKEDEELCYDYALVESNPNFSMACGCGASGCRRIVTGNDWKDEAFFSKNRSYMHPYLRRLLPILA